MRVVKKSFFKHLGMKYMTFAAVSSFVVTTENGQGHVNQHFALTLDSINPNQSFHTAYIKSNLFVCTLFNFYRLYKLQQMAAYWVQIIVYKTPLYRCECLLLKENPQKR